VAVSGRLPANYAHARARDRLQEIAGVPSLEVLIALAVRASMAPRSA
jgi:hypothetical protein